MSGNRTFKAQRKKVALLSKLLRIEKDSNSREVRDASYCRAVDFLATYDEDLMSRFRSQSGYRVDKLFGNETASVAYRMFRKFEVYDWKET